MKRITNEIIIDSLDKYVREIETLSKKYFTERSENETFCSQTLLYRGQADKNWLLLPSIARYKDSFSKLFFIERSIIEKAKNELPKIFGSFRSPIELLALLQHYGIPTRLLDVTENPLIALFFACNCCDKSVGEVIAFKDEKTTTYNSFIQELIADTYNLFQKSYMTLNDILDIAKSKNYCDDLIKIEQEMGNRSGTNTEVSTIVDRCSKVNFVTASKFSDRQKVQASKYILFNNAIHKAGEGNFKGKYFFETYIDPLNKNSDEVICRFIIPAENKKSIIQLLSQFGVSEKMLFPEDVSSACREVAREFGF